MLVRLKPRRPGIARLVAKRSLGSENKKDLFCNLRYLRSSFFKSSLQLPLVEILKYSDHPSPLDFVKRAKASLEDIETDLSKATCALHLHKDN